MKDEKDKATLDAFTVTAGKVGRPKTSTDDQKRELARLRQLKHQQKVRDNKKCLQFALNKIETIRRRKNRSDKHVLEQFLLFLNGGENIECIVTSSDDQDKRTDFEGLKKLIVDDADIDRIH